MIGKTVVATTALSLLTASAFGTSLIRLSLQQEYLASTYIIRGHVVSQCYTWNRDHSEILTLTTVAVKEVKKGHPPSQLVIEQLGGTMGNLNVRAPGCARLLVGTDYILFLETSRHESARCLLVGMLQGAYRIFRDSRTGVERIIRPASPEFMEAPTRFQQEKLEPAPELKTFYQVLWESMKTRFVIPASTELPVMIDSITPGSCEGRVVIGHITRTVFPSTITVVPEGSIIRGVENRAGQIAHIRWNNLAINGEHCDLLARSQLVVSNLKAGTALFATAIANN